MRYLTSMCTFLGFLLVNSPLLSSLVVSDALGLLQCSPNTIKCFDVSRVSMCHVFRFVTCSRRQMVEVSEMEQKVSAVTKRFAQAWEEKHASKLRSTLAEGVVMHAGALTPESQPSYKTRYV